MKRKGVSDLAAEAAEVAKYGITRLGHRGPIIIKADNEPALVALREQVMANLPGGAIPQEPPEGESQINGALENGVKRIRQGFAILAINMKNRLLA